MQAHDFLFADTADDSTTGIGTRHGEHRKRHRQAPSKQPRELTGIRQGQQNTMQTTVEASGDTMRRHT